MFVLYKVLLRILGTDNLSDPNAKQFFSGEMAVFICRFFPN